MFWDPRRFFTFHVKLVLYQVYTKRTQRQNTKNAPNETIVLIRKAAINRYKTIMVLLKRVQRKLPCRAGVTHRVSTPLVVTALDKEKRNTLSEESKR